MLGLRRRKRVEGWEVDVSEDGREERPRGLRERLADNNKLWLISITAILAIGLILALQARQSGDVTGQYVKNAKWPPAEAQPTEAHIAFSQEFQKDKSVAGKVIDARFIGQRRFRVVVPAEVSTDDMHYIARMAARKILLRFKHLSTVELYVQSAATGKRDLAATTRWDPEKYGFVVKVHKLSPNSP